MQLANALFRLLLEFLSRRREVGVFISEELVGNFAGQEHANIGVLMDPLAEQVHSHACADRCYIIGTEQVDDLIERG